LKLPAHGRAVRGNAAALGFDHRRRRQSFLVWIQDGIALLAGELGLSEQGQGGEQGNEHTHVYLQKTSSIPAS